MKLLLDDGDGAPDLRLHCVLARAQELLDPQMLLDPFEEQLDLPTILVKSGDGQCGPLWSVVRSRCKAHCTILVQCAAGF